MTIVSHCEVFETKGGQMMFIERYADKPFFKLFWRYGFMYSNGGQIHKDMLRSKPNKKRLIEKY